MIHTRVFFIICFLWHDILLQDVFNTPCLFLYDFLWPDVLLQDVFNSLIVRMSFTFIASSIGYFFLLVLKYVVSYECCSFFTFSVMLGLLVDFLLLLFSFYRESDQLMLSHVFFKFFLFFFFLVSLWHPNSFNLLWIFLLYISFYILNVH